MKRPFLLLLFLLTVLLLPGAASVSPSLAAPPSPTPWQNKIGAAANPALPHASDHILVKLRAGVRPLPGFSHIFGEWYRVPVETTTTPLKAMKMWAAQEEVQLVELDYTVQLGPQSRMAPAATGTLATNFIPNDPLFDLQWNFGRVQAPAAWEINTGSGVVVAVIDSGVSRGTDLACRTFVDDYNALTKLSGAGVAVDDFGHGTHVAGTIAQCTNNDLGVAGIAYNVQLMPVKVLDSRGYGSFSDIADGFDWARTHGADVINLSVGGPCYSSEWPQCSNSILNEAIQAAADADIVIVGAAGNFRQATVAQPANHPAVIAVAATNYFDGHAPYSNRGSALSVSAPGGDLNEDTDGDGVGDRIAILQQTFERGVWDYYYMDGTSMAAPHVAAAAALLRSQAPTADRLQIQQILESTALDLGDEGFDNTFGYGMIQIADALQAISAQFPTPTVTVTATPSSSPSPTLTPTASSTPTVTPTVPLVPAIWLPLLWQRVQPPPPPTPTITPTAAATATSTPTPADTPTPTATPIPAITPTPTATPLPSCRELVQNGSFEST
ncbi:MAG: S8 family serine peptidase, partial [Chloroflexi bacterium]|nr:S8 family serine peptidase [Chloroflexota bacterium]